MIRPYPAPMPWTVSYTLHDPGKSRHFLTEQPSLYWARVEAAGLRELRTITDVTIRDANGTEWPTVAPPDAAAAAPATTTPSEAPTAPAANVGEAA